MTKGLAVFLMIPGIFIYTVFTQKLKNVFLEKNIYWGIFITFSIIGGYYLLREMYNPGYIAEVMLNEFGRFSDQQSPEDVSNPYFYINQNIPEKFTPWLYFIPFTLFLLYKEEDKRIKKFGIYCFTICTCFLILISASSSKFAWYDVPFYPIAALLVSITLSKIFIALANYYNFKMETSKYLLLTFFCLAFFYLNYSVVARIIINRSYIWSWREEQYVDYLIKVA